jgi:osmoprotectant transport system substrate-binding protein
VSFGPTAWVRPGRIAAVGAMALVLAACGGSGGGGSGAGSGAGSGGAGASTGDTSTATPTATTSTTTTLPGTGRPSVTLGDKNTTEQFVLGELYDLALSAQGFSVSLTRNIGPPNVSYQALEQGNLNLYPEYLNVWNTQVVNDQHQHGSVASAFETADVWAEEHQLELLQPSPGADTQGIAVTSAFARAHHLRTLADLARLSPTLTLGAPLQFTQSATALPALEAAYGLTPAKTVTVVIGDQYKDLLDGTIEAAYVQTTDGELATSQFRLLSDPKHVNGFGNIVPVVTASTVAAEGPVFVDTLNRVDALLSTQALRVLNAQVDLEQMDPLTVAKQFLEQHGLLSAASAP